MIRKKHINKKAIYILTIFIILFVGYGIYQFSEGQKERKEEISAKLLSDKIYEGLRIEDIEISELEGSTLLLAKIKNETDNFHEKEEVNVVFLGQGGNVVCKTSTVIPNVEANKDSALRATIDKKCKNSYTFVIEKNKIER